MSKEEYNNIPVHYCTNCLSLDIRYTDDEIDFCDDCGDIDIEIIHIEFWEELYKNKYGKKFLQLKNKLLCQTKN